MAAFPARCRPAGAGSADPFVRGAISSVWGLRARTTAATLAGMRSVTRLPRRRAAVAALILGIVATGGLAPAGIAGPVAAADFPSYDSRYHTYAEMVAEIKAAESAYPSLVDVFTIGKSYEGRYLWAAKISDRVGSDEAEPEILFDSLHHAREHFTLEHALYLLRELTTKHGSDATVTRLVNYREIYIIFALNPDGAEYDLTGDPDAPYRAWRKNRQPNGSGQPIGTDLNRNYDYRWACCGGSSGDPASITYRGPSPFSAPEARAMRDFVNSRVIGGRQQIRAHITFHTNGELILYPYGYTYTDVPADMTVDDYNTFVAFARGQGARNGYKPQQSSGLYVTDGDQIDWMYGRHRIFSFTWELYPPEQGTVWGDHYPPDEQIAIQTQRNRSALLYFMDLGACPYKVLGSAKDRTHCGAYNDDLEIGRGWTADPYGTDTATSGRWQRGNPEGTSVSSRPKQLGSAASGQSDLATGLAAGGSATANDVDGGTTTVRSAGIKLPGTVGDLTFRYTLGTHYSTSSLDVMRAFVERADGTLTRVFSVYGKTGGRDGAWGTARINLDAWAGQTIRLVFTATDGGAESLVEAGIDDVRIERP